MITDVFAPVEAISLEENQLLLKKGGPISELWISVLITDNTPILMDASDKYTCNVDMAVTSIEDKDEHNKDGDLQ